MITHFGGPEGGGKTALMTLFCREHHLMGGEIWAFPGYEHKNQRGRVISKLIMPEQVMGKLDDMQYIVLVIDEIQNFMNHHAWYSKLVDIMAYGAAAQRRKREFVILSTGPIFDWLPKDLRMMYHVSVECRDVHWRQKEIPRGQQIAFTMTDERGVLSGYPGTIALEKLFYPKRVFPYFDTFSLVDPKYQHLRFKVQKDEVMVDSQGNLIADSDSETLNRYGEQFAARNITMKEFVRSKVSNALSGLMEQGKEVMPLEELSNFIKSQTDVEMDSGIMLRDHLAPLGCYRLNKKGNRALIALPITIPSS